MPNRGTYKVVGWARRTDPNEYPLGYCESVEDATALRSERLSQGWWRIDIRKWVGTEPPSETD